MKQLVRVAVDLLLEAARRKWFLALFGAITLVLVSLGFSLQLDVVDGAIAGSKLFGSLLFDDIVSANQVMAGLYKTVAYLSFYGGAFTSRSLAATSPPSCSRRAASSTSSRCRSRAGNCCSGHSPG